MDHHVKDFFLRKYVLRRRLRLLQARQDRYRDVADAQARVDWQLRRFNAVWAYCRQAVPFYREWCQRHRLPERIDVPGDLDHFPALTKPVLQEHEDLVFAQPEIRGSISTGGSTGQPTRFPLGEGESDEQYATMYLGRSWWGIAPLDPMIAFWGHSHLFGSGLRGRINELKRNLYDRVLNIRRLDAYDMTPETIARYAQELRRRDPVFLQGYTSCLYKLAKYMDEHGLDLGRARRLKAAIATAETVSDADIDLVREALGIPLVIEYGMAETGVLAYSRDRPRNMEVFWDACLARQASDGVLHVSTIGPRLFPLINYRTDDRADVSTAHDGSVLALSAVVGRSRDLLSVRTAHGGRLELSGILFVHVLKSYPGLYSIQFEQRPDAAVRIFVVGDRALDLAGLKAHFLAEIGKDHPDIDGAAIDLVQVPRAELTVAGKESMLR